MGSGVITEYSRLRTVDVRINRSPEELVIIFDGGYFPYLGH